MNKPIDPSPHEERSSRSIKDIKRDNQGAAELPSYCIFDGLQWENKRGLGRFTTQLKKHLEQTQWRRLTYPRPGWKSSAGRVALNQVVEPIWLRMLDPDVAIYPHNVLPSCFLNRRSLRVLVLHDILFLDSSNQSAGNRYRSAQLKRSLQNADLILTVSQVSREEIMRLSPRETPIMVLPNALAEGFAAISAMKAPVEDNIVRILHFGGHAPTKNTKAVLGAVSSLRRDGQNVHLMLASMFGQAELVERWRRETHLPVDAMTVLPRLSDDELRRVVAGAAIHCMPSTGEGFGIPVIEAARCGVVNVLSPLPVFRELMGGDAIFADSFSAESIARALKTCIDADVSSIREQARVRTERFLFETVHRLDAVPICSVIEEMVDSRRKNW